MAALYAPRPMLRRRPRERLRTARGRCGLLLLHRSGLAPPTPCRSPGAVVHPKNETRKIGDSFSRRGTDDEAPGVSDSIEAGRGGAPGGRGERHRGSAGSAVAGPAFVCVAGQGSTEWVGGVAWMGTTAQGGNGGGGPGGGMGGGRGRAGGCAAAGRRAGA